MSYLPVHDPLLLPQGALSRRDFVARSVAVALVGAACAACGGAIAGPTSGGNTPPIDLSIRVSDFPALGSVGGIATVDGGTGTPVGVGRTGASSFAAYTRYCTHAGTIVNVANDVPTQWYCPNHGARFAADGSVVEGSAAVSLRALVATYTASTGVLRITG